MTVRYILPCINWPPQAAVCAFLSSPFPMAQLLRVVAVSLHSGWSPPSTCSAGSTRDFCVCCEPWPACIATR
jgi:hypothetical protein